MYNYKYVFEPSNMFSLIRLYTRKVIDYYQDVKMSKYKNSILLQLS